MRTYNCAPQSICKMFSTCSCNVNINMQLSSHSMFALPINAAAVTYSEQTPQAALPFLSRFLQVVLCTAVTLTPPLLGTLHKLMLLSCCLLLSKVHE